MTKQALNEEQSPAFFPHRENSETAASAHNRIFPTSGVMPYRVTVVTGTGLTFADVDAATGDEAAEKALVKFPGSRVAHVEPAPKAD